MSNGHIRSDKQCTFFKILSADDNEKLLRLRVYRCIAFLERERRGRGRREGEMGLREKRRKKLREDKQMDVIDSLRCVFLSSTEAFLNSTNEYKYQCY